MSQGVRVNPMVVVPEESSSDSVPCQPVSNEPTSTQRARQSADGSETVDLLDVLGCSGDLLWALLSHRYSCNRFGNIQAGASSWELCSHSTSQNLCNYA